MEQEKDDLLNLKMELEKTIEKLCCGKDEVGNFNIVYYILIKN